MHTEDAVSLKDALKAHLSGQTPHFQHEHRIRQEDGTYRTFLCRGLARRGAGRSATRIAGSLTDTTDYALAQQLLRSAGFRDPLTGLRNRADFVGRARPAARAIQAAESRRRTIRDPLSRPRSLQGGERQSGPPRGRRDADRCLAAPRVVPADGGLAGAPRRRRVRHPPADGRRRVAGERHRVPYPGITEQADYGRGPRGVHDRRASASPSAPASTAIPTRSCATPTRRCTTPSRAARRVTRCSTPTCTRARATSRPGERPATRGQPPKTSVGYQPIVPLGTGMSVGFESLSGGPAPAKRSRRSLYPYGRRAGAHRALGTWVLQQACHTFAQWQRQYPDSGLDYITVNVSSRQLMQQNFLRIVEQAVEKSGMKPRDLRLEITETALMDRPDDRRGGAESTARVRRENRSRRLRHRLFVTELSAQASGRCPQDRPLVREEPCPSQSVRRSSRASWRWPGR